MMETHLCLCLLTHGCVCSLCRLTLCHWLHQMWLLESAQSRLFIYLHGFINIHVYICIGLCLQEASSYKNIWLHDQQHLSYINRNKVMQFLTKYAYGWFSHVASSKNIFLHVYSNQLYKQRSVTWLSVLAQVSISIYFGTASQDGSAFQPELQPDHLS